MVGISLRLLQASSVLSLAVLAACGGRTTGLEPGNVDFDPSVPSDGGSSGSAGSSGSTAGKGGSPGTGTGGVTVTAGSTAGGTAGSVPSGGASQGGSAGAIDAVTQVCQDYCKAGGAGACDFAGEYGQCYSSCTQQLYAESGGCQWLGIQLIDCITNSHSSSNSCIDFGECAGVSQAYSQCTSPSTPPAPVPPPAPTSCSTSSSSNGNYCSLDMKCSDGSYYSVNCNQSGPNLSTCSCKSISSNGSGSGGGFTLNESVDFACFDGLSVCGFPQAGLK